MKFAAIFVAIVGTVSALQGGSQCDLKAKAKECVVNSVSVANRKFPETLTEMNAACANLAKGEKCVNDFIKNCASNAKETANLNTAMGGAIRAFKRACASDDTRAAFVQNLGKCGNSARLDVKTKCYLPYKKYVITAAESGDKNLMMKTVCW